LITFFSFILAEDLVTMYDALSWVSIFGTHSAAASLVPLSIKISA
jgi:hypothetical protein